MSKKKPEIPAWEAFLRGLSEGASFGFSGELSGVASQLDEFGKRLGGAPPTDYGQLYREGKEATQELLRSAEEQHPYAAYGGQLAGALIVPVPGGAAANAAARSGQIGRAARIAALGHAATGAVGGIGRAEGSARDLASNTAKEAALSAVAGGSVQRYGPQAAQKLRDMVIRSSLLRQRLGQYQERLGDIAEKAAAKSATLIEPGLSVESTKAVDNQSAPSGVDVVVMRDPSTGERTIVVRPKQQ